MASEVVAPALLDHGGGRPNGNGNGVTTPPKSAQPTSTTVAAEPTPLFPDHDDDPSAPSDSEEEEDESASSRPVTSPVTSPPYWPQGQASAAAHAPGGDRSGSGAGGRALGTGLLSGFAHNPSTESVVPAGAITLQDNEAADVSDGPDRTLGRDRNRACWAKSVHVTDYVVVNGSATNFGAFVVWNVRVETLSGSHMNIRKRYSEFDDLRQRLIFSFPNFEAAVPALPPKTVLSNFRPKFLEKRRAGLQYFLNCILLNPEFSGSPVLKDFLFS